MIYTMVLLVVINKIGDRDNFRDAILSAAFPILIVLGIILSVGQFVSALTLDREDKTRYLLNFAGMRSTSYVLGTIFAEYLNFVAPQILLIIMVFILKITTFEQHMVLFFGNVFVSGFPIIASMHLISHMFDKHMTAFKYSLPITMLITAILLTIQNTLLKNEGMLIVDVFSPFVSLYSNMADILVNTGSSRIEIPKKALEKIYTRMVFYAIQFVVFVFIGIFIDYRRIHSFRGMDSNK